VDHSFFPLRNAHYLDCIQCHAADGYTGLDPDCTSCHEPDRPAGHFVGEECGGCHHPTTWADAHVDHSFFPLQAAHELNCRACHDGTEFGGLSSECSACHEPDRPEDHFPDADCAPCHAATLWEDPTYEHTTLPLVQAHDLACSECHTGADFTGLEVACESCHEIDRPPEHFVDDDCVDCHAATVWEDATFDHTMFPLTDAHVVACVECHAGPGYAGESSECASCHEAERPAEHFVGEDCASCHAATTWPDATFDHTFFALAGAHAVACAECHPGPGYEGQSPVCASCHEQARPTDHFAGTDCVLCHAPTLWTDGTFDHSFFALADAHAVACAECHPGPGYTGQSSACASCHEADRPATTHFTGEECAPCHHPTTWSDVTWDHDPYFPLPHRTVSACAECHLAYPDASTFSCIDCHEHSEANAGSHHVEVLGYSWVSSECLRCHPQGVVVAN